MRILVVEDDPLLSGVLRAKLEAECFAVDIADTGEQGSFLARTNDYDVVLLDYMLPGKDGRTVCEEIRASGHTPYILMLTVKSEIETKVDLLNCGVDDFMTKPYSFEELTARIRAVLRRPKQLESKVLSYKQVSLDPQRQLVLRDDKEIYLTRKEYMLLEYLLRQKGNVVSRASLGEHVWDSDLDAFSNTIESHMLNLRRKIDRKGAKSLIQTLPGRGYKIG